MLLPRPLSVVLTSMLFLAARLDIVAAGEPKVEVTRFKNVPSKIAYFEDTTVSLYLTFPAGFSNPPAIELVVDVDTQVIKIRPGLTTIFHVY